MQSKYRKYEIISSSVNGLVSKGVKLIQKHGKILERSGQGPGLQLSNVNFILTDSHNRVHSTRSPASVEYFAGELLKFFKGTDNADEMAEISKSWLKNANSEGKINSNYGRYTFHKEGANGERSKYHECRGRLVKNPWTRRATIPILSSVHSMNSEDYPCTFGLHFLIEDGMLNCIASSRSTDIITGLPYDMGFFSFVNELLCADLQEHGLEVELGYTAMKSNFTQIYDKTKHLAEQIIQNRKRIKKITMPQIISAKELVSDIYGSTSVSDTIKWCLEYAKKPLSS